MELFSSCQEHAFEIICVPLCNEESHAYYNYTKWHPGQQKSNTIRPLAIGAICRFRLGARDRDQG